MIYAQRKYLQRILVFTILGLFLLPQPILAIGGSNSDPSSSQAYIEPLLLDKMQTSKSSIPIIIHFSNSVEDDSLDWFVNHQTPNELVVRHVFYDMKIISAYATTEEIQQMSSLGDVAGITLDKTWKVDDNPIESPVYEAKSESEYINPDQYMYADELWAQGYNGYCCDSR